MGPALKMMNEKSVVLFVNLYPSSCNQRSLLHEQICDQTHLSGTIAELWTASCRSRPTMNAILLPCQELTLQQVHHDITTMSNDRLHMDCYLRPPFRCLLLDSLLLLPLFNHPFDPLPPLPLLLPVPLLLLTPAIPLAPNLPSDRLSCPLDLFPLLAFLCLACDSDRCDAPDFTSLDVCWGCSVNCLEQGRGVDWGGDR